MVDPSKVVSASRVINAPANVVFELIANPDRQPEWDGNGNLDVAQLGQRVHGVGDVFEMRTTKGKVRENHVVEFEEGRRIAWLPAGVGEQPAGHLWRWELKPLSDDSTMVTHTYDWSNLTDPARFERAQWTTSERLMASINNLAEVAEVREPVRAAYAAAAQSAGSRDAEANTNCCGGSSCCGGQDQEIKFGRNLYDATQVSGIPQSAVLASLGCGNPTAVADLQPGEVVLDLGSGGGIDVLLSAQRVGPDGFAYGVDMTDEMLALARKHAAEAGVTNVEFLKGTIERVPLPDESLDVVISNCVIDLSSDKPAVMREMFRLLAPGGRIGISDVVSEDHLTPEERAQRGTYVGCIAGAISKQEYLDGLTAAGFTNPSVEFTHEVAPQMHGAIIKAMK
jgi:SAM-dependent methyltransferase/uncharacterized protein YndB with AHSA1/START domain